VYPGSLGTRRYIGNNRTKKRKKGIKENNILFISDKSSDLRITNNSYYTYRRISIKHTIPVVMIGGLLLLIGKQNHDEKS
jgi:hypothetical protein